MGGGLLLVGSDATVIGNTVVSNTSQDVGGGLCLHYSDATLIGNTIFSNTAQSIGGGLSLGESDATLVGNIVSFNTSQLIGGGLALFFGNATIDGNTISHNTAVTYYGGGLNLEFHAGILVNNVIAHNHAGRTGGGVAFGAAESQLLHNTFARNTSDGAGGLAVKWGCSFLPCYPSSIAMTDTILVSHTVGIGVSDGCSAALEATLWGTDTWANEADWTGDGTIITGTFNIWDEPGFVDPDAGDYHIAHNSAAIDAGVDAGIMVDIDGEYRPMGTGYDIGADEFPHGLGITKAANPEVALAGELVTYTLRAISYDSFTHTATMIDILPAHVTPTGVLTWAPVTIVPYEAWTETVVVTVEAGYHGVLTNVLHMASLEGYSGAYTLTTPVYIPVQASFVAEPITGLSPLVVIFANTSKGDYVTSLWRFGDGVTSTVQSPTNTYTAVGGYTVTLTVEGPGGVDTEVKERYITVQHGVYLPVILRSG
jgi:parallel beta-helix repeat protein